jgi:hypothetical protein
MLGRNNNLRDIKQVVKRCIAEISAQQCLLVFNNAEDTILQSSSLSTAEAADLANCLPQLKLCSTIFTTTSNNTA